VRLWLLAALTVLGVLLGRAMLEGRAALRRADEADARGDVEATVAYSMRAAKWYVPFAAHPSAAYDKLREVARRAEASGDADTALIAWQAIRAATRASRGPWTPFAERAQEADAQIAVLLASRPAPGIDRDKPRDRLIQEHRALLAGDDGPRPFAVVALYTGLFVAVLASYRLLGALDAALEANANREAERRRALAALGVTLVGFALFVVALSRA
jgi:hypothetical protein